MNKINKSWVETMDNENVQQSTSTKMKTTDRRENYSSRKRPRPNGKNDTEPKLRKAPRELETDPTVLQRRQKQIDYGKNTFGYHNYIQQVPVDKRKKDDPKTPDKYSKYSRRSWDALIKIWRKKLHEYDTSKADSLLDSDSDDDDTK